jgi:thiaminase
MFVRRGPGLVGMAARTAVVAGTATAVSGRVARKQQSKYAEQDAQYMEQQGAAVAQGAEQAAAQPDYVAELEQLAKLKEQGIITEEEFEAKKKQALGI